MKTGFDPIGSINIGQNYVTRFLNSGDLRQFRAVKKVLKILSSEGYLIDFTQHKNYVVAKKKVITYPHEWPIEAFFQAALFHLKLFLVCKEKGIWIKDGMLTNVLFDKNEAVFVDFGSFYLRRIEEANNEKQRFSEIIKSMFFPYCLLPLLAFYFNKNQLARSWLSDRFCNTIGKPPSISELINKSDKLTFFKTILFIYWNQIALKVFSIEKYCSITKFILENYFHPCLEESNYTAYYKKKCSNLSNAKNSPKTISVCNLLKKIKIKKVLDLGANTGLFSILASNRGLQVIAVEEDESCANELFKMAQEKKLPIYPMVTSFEKMNKEIYANKNLYNLKKPPVLFLAPQKRVVSDCVLCLGLMHHLVLGRGITLGSVFKTLAALSEPFLILEVVLLEDELIQNEPEFFKNYGKMHRHYTKENIYKELKVKFKLIATSVSDAKTRSIVLCKRKQKKP
jgi:hypothetical protein